jgi:hypothetical protein
MEIIVDGFNSNNLSRVMIHYFKYSQKDFGQIELI